MSTNMSGTEQARGRAEKLQSQIAANPKQAGNINAIIRYYQQGGALPEGDNVVYAFNGNVGYGTLDKAAEVLRREANGAVPYFDISVYQLVQRAGISRQSGNDLAIDQSTDDVPNSADIQMAQRATCVVDPFSGMHEMQAQFRYPPWLGGHHDLGRFVSRTIHNDTGSNIQGIRRDDWNRLNCYGTSTSLTSCKIATGDTIEQEYFVGEIRIVTKDPKTGETKALTDWLTERFLIVN